MFENIKEDVSDRGIEYLYLSLISNNIRVGIIGGGKAGAIKAKSFWEKGAYVEVLSNDFHEYFYQFKNNKLTLNNNSYNKGFIKDKHIIIIAVDDNKLIEKIEKDCKEDSRIYINATDFRSGLAVVPVQRTTKNLSIAISTKVGNPKGAVMVAEKTLKLLNEYDDFIDFSGKIRKRAKELKDGKKTIIDFVCTEDFKYIYSKKKDKEVLKMFFNDNIVEFLYGGNV